MLQKREVTLAEGSGRSSIEYQQINPQVGSDWSWSSNGVAPVWMQNHLSKQGGLWVFKHQNGSWVQEEP